MTEQILEEETAALQKELDELRAANMRKLERLHQQRTEIFEKNENLLKLAEQLPPIEELVPQELTEQLPVQQKDEEFQKEEELIPQKLTEQLPAQQKTEELQKEDELLQQQKNKRKKQKRRRTMMKSQTSTVSSKPQVQLIQEPLQRTKSEPHKQFFVTMTITYLGAIITSIRTITTKNKRKQIILMIAIIFMFLIPLVNLYILVFAPMETVILTSFHIISVITNIIAGIYFVYKITTVRNYQPHFKVLLIYIFILVLYLWAFLSLVLFSVRIG